METASPASDGAGSVHPKATDQSCYPEEWRSLEQFVCCSVEIRGGKKTKIPKNPLTGRNAKTNDPSTWGTREQALEAAGKNGFDGVGFVFSPSDKYVFVDLDGCRDPDTGIIDSWALEIVEKLNSYTAVSISDTGLHVYIEASEDVRNRIDSGRKQPVDAQPHGDKKPAVEIYAHHKYAALSGKRLDGSPTEICLNDEGLEWFLAKYWGALRNDVPRIDKSQVAGNDETNGLQAQAGEGGGPRPTTPGRNSSGAVRNPQWLLSEAEVEAKIKDAVTRQGPDFYFYYRNPQQTLAGGNSASEFECRLVACALFDQWSPREIQSLLYRFRVRHGFPNPEKAFRDDYVDRTIAYVERTRDNAFEELDEPHDDLPDEASAAESKNHEDPRVHLDKFPHTESGNAERLIARHGANLRYAADEGCWYVWNEREGHWERDPDGDIVGRLYIETMRATYAAALRLSGKDERSKLQTWARGSESAAKVKSGLFLARANPAIRYKAADFENRPWLLNVKDSTGNTVTIELKSGKVRPPSRADMMLHVLLVAYDPAAQCSRWRQFIREITCERDELARFLQRVAAYCLTGDIGEQVFFFAYGSGANGKSTFVGVLLRLLGPYGQRSMSDTFWAEKNHSRHPVEMADLQGVRMCVIQEIEPDRKWAIERIKQLTGEPETRARHLYKNPFTFTNTAKLFFNGNALPGVSDHSEGFWRRMRQIPFDATIPKEDRVRNFDNILWKEESSGILNWALEQMASVITTGVGVSAEVEEATAKYRRQADEVGRFVEECCATGEGRSARAGTLYDAFCAWSRRSSLDGEDSGLSQRDFAQRLNQLGYSTKRVSKGISYVGIGLLGTEAERD